MYDVFISYRRGKGSDLSSYIDSDLSKRGFNCFFDVNEKYSGDFMVALEEGIKNSSLFVILITEGSLERLTDKADVPMLEIELAIKHKVDILPISLIGNDMFKLLDEIPNMPESAKKLKNVHCLFYKHESKQNTMNYLIEVLERNRDLRFKDITTKALSRINKISDKELNSYIEVVTDKVFDHLGKTFKYTGTLKFGRPDGEGTLTDLAHGLIYKLDWNPYGDYQGKGELYKGSKLIYKGEVSELNYEGKGTLYEKEYSYEGMFREGKIRGFGVMTLANGDILSGEWLANTLHSKGHVRYKNGNEYFGKLSDNIPHGYGVLIKQDGKKFDGFFRKGKIEQGALYLTDGIFIGTFENEEPDGRGKMYDLNFSKVLEGTFKKGKLSGYGKFYIKGKSLLNILPKAIYFKMKEYYPDLDSKELILNGKFDGVNLLEYDDFKVTDAVNMSTVCEGHIKNFIKEDYWYKVYLDYEEVYTNAKEF